MSASKEQRRRVGRLLIEHSDMWESDLWDAVFAVYRDSGRLSVVEEAARAVLSARADGHWVAPDGALAFNTALIKLNGVLNQDEASDQSGDTTANEVTENANGCQGYRG